MNGFIPQRKLTAESGAEIFLIILLKPAAGEIINQIRLSAPAERNEKRFDFSQIADGVRNLFAVKNEIRVVVDFYLAPAYARDRFSVFLNPVSVGKADAVKIPVADDPCSRQRP